MKITFRSEDPKSGMPTGEPYEYQLSAVEVRIQQSIKWFLTAICGPEND